jgi:hypothetical protein
VRFRSSYTDHLMRPVTNSRRDLIAPNLVRSALGTFISVRRDVRPALATLDNHLCLPSGEEPSENCADTHELSCSGGSELMVLVGCLPEILVWTACKPAKSLFLTTFKVRVEGTLSHAPSIPFPCPTTRRFSVAARTVMSVLLLRGLWLNTKRMMAQKACGPSVRYAGTLSHRSDALCAELC